MAKSNASEAVGGPDVKNTAPTLDTLPNEIQQMIYFYAVIDEFDQSYSSYLGWNLFRVSTSVQANAVAAARAYARRMTKYAMDFKKELSAMNSAAEEAQIRSGG
jgi:hypothetical protein